jgi:TIR domain
MVVNASSPASYYRQRLVVYIVWHPRFAHGWRIGDALWAHLNTPSAHPGGGLGIPVLFRSVPAGGEVPAPVDFAEARNTAVVLLVDDEMAADEAWGRYAEGLWNAAAAAADGAHRVFPVRLSPSALNLSPRLAAANFIRPLETPGGPPLTDDRAAAALADDWDATLCRLQNAVVHELCRMLRARPRADHGSADPAALPAGEKITVFLSHTKADGVPVARGIKAYIEGELQLRTFFDANDIDYGADFDPVLRRAVGAENAALLVVQTDAYAGSMWCLEELLEAKRHRRPVLVVHAVAAGEERAPVYAGNVPTRRFTPGGPAPRYDRIVGRLLLEVLWRDHFVQQFEDVRALFGLPADIRPLPYPPEPLTLADLRVAGETNKRYVYPNCMFGSHRSGGWRSCRDDCRSAWPCPCVPCPPRRPPGRRGTTSRSCTCRRQSATSGYSSCPRTGR